MKSVPSYPLWLTVFIVLGPFFMVAANLMSTGLAWFFEIAGAAMLMVALVYLSKRLHEQTEEIASLRSLLKGKDAANPS
jgi:membrane associated rhomboid family serine protease